MGEKMAAELRGSSLESGKRRTNADRRKVRLKKILASASLAVSSFAFMTKIGTCLAVILLYSFFFPVVPSSRHLVLLLATSAVFLS